jgi:hypothetical protein
MQRLWEAIRLPGRGLGFLMVLPSPGENPVRQNRRERLWTHEVRREAVVCRDVHHQSLG